jgi:hypothetical protein
LYCEACTGMATTIPVLARIWILCTMSKRSVGTHSSLLKQFSILAMRKFASACFHVFVLGCVGAKVLWGWNGVSDTGSGNEERNDGKGELNSRTWHGKEHSIFGTAYMNTSWVFTVSNFCGQMCHIAKIEWTIEVLPARTVKKYMTAACTFLPFLPGVLQFHVYQNGLPTRQHLCSQVYE